jgi:hypothetical protein
VAIGFAAFWIAGIVEANRLEAGIVTAAANVAGELEAEHEAASARSAADHDIRERESDRGGPDT